MNKNYVIVLIVLLILAIGVVIYFVSGSREVSYNATSTPPLVSNNNTNPTTSQQPAMPTTVTSSSFFVSDNSVALVGTVNPKGAITNYWYEYGKTSNLGSATPKQTIGSGYISIQAPGYITNLLKSTTYYFKLVAENQFGKVSGNQFTFKTTEGTPAPVGSSPTTKTLSAGSISRTVATINGEVTPNKSVTQYWFEYGKTTELGNTSAFSLVGNGSVKVPVSVQLSDLEPLTTYYFRLNAQNQFGTINGSILNFKTTGPSVATAPKIVSQNATALATSSVTLNGIVTPNGAETDYWFEYSTDSLFGSILINMTDKVTMGLNENTTSVQTNVSNLDSKTTYYFRLVGQNSQGTVRGDKISFKTK